MELEEFHVAVFYYNDKIFSTTVDYTNQIKFLVYVAQVTSVKQKIYKTKNHSTI